MPTISRVPRSIILESGTLLRAAQLHEPDGVWERIALLQRDDRILLELSLRGGASYRQISRLLGRSPGSIQRRIRRLIARVRDPLVIELLDPTCPLDPDHRQIGVEHFLVGQTTPELAAKHAMPAGRVRQVLHFLRGWHRGRKTTRWQGGKATR